MSVADRVSTLGILGASAALVLGMPAIAAPAAPPAPPAVVELKAALIGANEIPGPGDLDGTGSAAVSIDLAAGKLCYTLMVANVEGVTMAHIHKAPTGSMGNVVVPLSPPTSGSSQGCVQIRPELLAGILTTPSDYYVNVHSETNIAGAVRGQLGKGESATPTAQNAKP